MGLVFGSEGALLQMRLGMKGRARASYFEEESRIKGEESEKATEGPASARAPARSWRRIAD